MTGWSDLNDDIPRWMERDVTQDTELAAAIPRFIANAQTRILAEWPLTIFNEEVTGVMSSGSAFIPRPSDLRRMGGIFVNYQGNTYLPMYPRLRSFINEFWPDRSLTRSNKPPRYWAPYSDTQIIVAPTPSGSFSYRIEMQGEPSLLSSANTDNVISNYHYDALLAAALVEATMWSQEDQATEIRDRFEQRYQELRKAAIANEGMILVADQQSGTQRGTGA